jgi:metal-responsive CopG/Arc/MetJ family transcriptional regulator
MSVPTARQPLVLRSRKERVLVEFPGNLLERADDAARKLGKNRSELIRAAVEQFLDEMETKRFELELAAAYTANAQMSREIMEEFVHVDSEGF